MTTVEAPSGIAVVEGVSIGDVILLPVQPTGSTPGTSEAYLIHSHRPCGCEAHTAPVVEGDQRGGLWSVADEFSAVDS